MGIIIATPSLPSPQTLSHSCPSSPVYFHLPWFIFFTIALIISWHVVYLFALLPIYPLLSIQCKFHKDKKFWVFSSLLWSHSSAKKSLAYSRWSTNICWLKNTGTVIGYLPHTFWPRTGLSLQRKYMPLTMNLIHDPLVWGLMLQSLNKPSRATVGLLYKGTVWLCFIDLFDITGF